MAKVEFPEFLRFNIERRATRAYSLDFSWILVSPARVGRQRVSDDEQSFACAIVG